jgi:6-phosphogluconate dehydrogenase
MAGLSFGIVGLGVMGENLALNIESRGASVIGFDLDPKKEEHFISHSVGSAVR